MGYFYYINKNFNKEDIIYKNMSGFIIFSQNSIQVIIIIYP